MPCRRHRPLLDFVSINEINPPDALTFFACIKALQIAINTQCVKIVGRGIDRGRAGWAAVPPNVAFTESALVSACVGLLPQYFTTTRIESINHILTAWISPAAAFTAFITHHIKPPAHEDRRRAAITDFSSPQLFRRPTLGILR